LYTCRRAARRKKRKLGKGREVPPDKKSNNWKTEDREKKKKSLP